MQEARTLQVIGHLSSPQLEALSWILGVLLGPSDRTEVVFGRGSVAESRMHRAGFPDAPEQIHADNKLNVYTSNCLAGSSGKSEISLRCSCRLASRRHVPRKQTPRAYLGSWTLVISGQQDKYKDDVLIDSIRRVGPNTKSLRSGPCPSRVSRTAP